MADGGIRAEAAIAEVLDLFGRFRSEGGFGGRARIAVQASRAMAALTPEQRRQLAVDVAQQAAPHLVERIESEADVDLTPAQVRAVIEMAGNMNRDDLDALRSSMQDPAWQRHATERVLGTADAALGDAGVELEDIDVSDLLPPATTEEVDEDGLADETDEAEDLADEVEAEVLAHEDETEDLVGEPAAAADVDQPRTIAYVEPPDGPREPPQPQVTPSRYDEYEISLPEVAEWRAPGLDDSAFQFTPPPPRSRPSSWPDVTDLEPPAEQSWFGGGSLEIEPVVPARTELGERLRAVERSSEQLRVFRDAADEFVEMSPGEQASVLRALRATWVRRRAVLALIAEARLPHESARRVVGAFDSPMNRTWVVASLVEAGIGTVDEWADLLTPAAAARLARRYAA